MPVKLHGIQGGKSLVPVRPIYGGPHGARGAGPGPSGRSGAHAAGPRIAAEVPSAVAEPPRGAPNPVNKLVVSVYKTFGFAVLTFILLGLASYLAINVFYLFNAGWIEPTVVSPTDERVLQLSSQLAEQASLRDKLKAERADLVARLGDNQRVLKMEEEFQENFRRAIHADLAARKSELARLRRLTESYLGAKDEILKSSHAYAGLERERLAEQKDAHLIDEDRVIGGNFQLSQLAHSNLSLAEKETEISTRTSELEREAQSLEALAQKNERGELSYDVLRLKREFVKSGLDAAKARDEDRALRESIGAADASIARYDRMLGAISGSPYLLAVEHNLNIAFVPYDNLSHLEPGANLYGCAVGPLFCHRVGRVVKVLEGEVQGKHPLHSQMLRGVMVELSLDDAQAAHSKVLFVRRRPLLL